MWSPWRTTSSSTETLVTSSAELYGDAGAHARSAVGMAALPNQACVEIEMILEIED